MVRGRTSPVGSTRVSANGYHYTQTTKGSRLTHHLIAEQKLGRPIRDNERVVFKDGSRRNLSKDNIEVVVKGSATKARERARITARIQELQADLRALDD